MEPKRLKRLVYWLFIFFFILVIGLFKLPKDFTLFSRLMSIISIAVLSAIFRLERVYSFLSFALAVLAALFSGAVFAENVLQFWLLSILFIAVFFLTCYVFEKEIVKPSIKLDEKNN
jgi:hypothetical protein